MMHNIISPSHFEHRRLGSFSVVAQRTFALMAVLGACVAVMGAQTNNAANAESGTVAQQSRDQAQPSLNLQPPASDALFSTSASENVDPPVTEASLVPTVPNFAKMMQYGGVQGQGYNRPRYQGSESHPWVFYAGAGFSQPVGDTWNHLTPNYNLQVGTGPQFGKHFALPAEFDFDYFDFTRKTLTDQSTIYFNADHVGLGGNSHIWSFSLDPTYTFYNGSSLGAYFVAGVGFFHKIANFTLPSAAYSCYYYCGVYAANVNIDHYTSNAPGYDAGIGLTWRVAPNSAARWYAEARYVFIDNQQRYGVNINNYTTAPTTSTDFYPANSNRTTYVPIKFGIRF